MAQQERFTLIASLDSLKIGDTFTEWPLHLTILPQFHAHELNQDAFNVTVQKQVDVYHHLQIEGRDFAYFGPNNDIPVRKVHSDGLISLHNDLLDSVLPYVTDAEWASDYIGKDYSPHISDIGSRYFDEGKIVIIRSLHLIARKKENKKGVAKKKVVAAYPFGAYHEQN
jgi:hypothetical protein